MKLIHCALCGDVLGLRMALRVCRCGRSAGCYQSDRITVAVGGPCLVLGLAQRDLVGAWQDEQLTSIACDVIREPHPTIHRAEAPYAMVGGLDRGSDRRVGAP